MEKSHNKIDEVRKQSVSSINIFILFFTKKARKVYMTALSTYRSFSESEQLAAPLMYQMFAKLEMENGQPAEALKILVSMSGDKPYGMLSFLHYIYIFHSNMFYTDVNMPLPTATLILRAREV